MGDFLQRINDRYPLHWLVWEDRPEALSKELEANANIIDCELRDPRGRTPLHLAVTLQRLECCKVLLKHGANSNAENSGNWTVLQEAVCGGDPHLVALILQHRDQQRSGARLAGIPQLLQKLREAPDFYIEMKWEFTSWVPLVSRVSPSDTYRVFKSGSNVRIDTTLVGFDSMSWQRGSRSMIFKGQSDSATFLEINHDAHTVSTETVAISPTSHEEDLIPIAPNDEAVEARLSSPAVTTFVETEKIAFERNKSGFIPGWRSDKTETVSGYDCKVFTAHNVEVITKTRTEHLSERDRKHAQGGMNLLQSFLGIGEKDEDKEDEDLQPSRSFSINNLPPNPSDLNGVESEGLGEEDSFLHQPGFSSADPDPPHRQTPISSPNPVESDPTNSAQSARQNPFDTNNAETDLNQLSLEGGASGAASNVRINCNPFNMSAQEYFDENFDQEAERDIGRRIEEQTKTQKFKATLWLSEDYPLQLQDQVLPIIDLMALNNAWFKKLRDFITLQLPSGFPVKIEIPLFHVMNARVTFSNIFAMDNPVEGVHMLEDLQGSINCCVNEAAFEVPSGYRPANSFDPTTGVYTGPAGHPGRLYDEEDAMLQYAIQQSLMESGMGPEQLSVWEALEGTGGSQNGGRTANGDVRQQAFNPSFNQNPNMNLPRLPPRPPHQLVDEEERMLQAAIEESMRMQQREQAVVDGDLTALDQVDVQIPLTVDEISTQQQHQEPQPLQQQQPQQQQPFADEEMQLRIALQLSQQAQDEERQRQEREEEELQRILALSLTEK